MLYVRDVSAARPQGRIEEQTRASLGLRLTGARDTEFGAVVLHTAYMLHCGTLCACRQVHVALNAVKGLLHRQPRSFPHDRSADERFLELIELLHSTQSRHNEWGIVRALSELTPTVISYTSLVMHAYSFVAHAVTYTRHNPLGDSGRQRQKWDPGLFSLSLGLPLNSRVPCGHRSLHAVFRAQ